MLSLRYIETRSSLASSGEESGDLRAGLLMCSVMTPACLRARRALALVLPFALVALPARPQTPDSASQLRSEFANPSAEARPMMRWWWFGPAVVKPELARELDVMHAAGIGGVELAAVYPLALDDPAKNLLNARYASPEYVNACRPDAGERLAFRRTGDPDRAGGGPAEGCDHRPALGQPATSQARSGRQADRSLLCTLRIYEGF